MAIFQLRAPNTNGLRVYEKQIFNSWLHSYAYMSFERLSIFFKANGSNIKETLSDLAHLRYFLVNNGREKGSQTREVYYNIFFAAAKRRLNLLSVQYL